MIAPDRVLRMRLCKRRDEVDRALRFLIRQAYSRVAYHRTALDAAGVRPADIRGTADLVRLPLMHKRVLVGSDPRTLVRRGVRVGATVRTTTSGSSGFPLTVHMNRIEFTYQKLVLWSLYRRYVSLRLPLTIAAVGSMVPHGGRSWIQRAGLARVLRLPADLPVEEQVEQLVAFHPQLVKGFPTSLEIVAERLLDRGLALRARLVAVGGEVLHGHVRALLQQAFGCRVVDLYSCVEGGEIAFECPDDPSRMHVNSAVCHLEILNDARMPVVQGHEGQVFLTNLFNLTMPLVRYEIGDRALFLGEPQGTCSCGAEGPMLGRVEGWDDDVMIRPDGEKLSPRVPANLVFNALRSSTDVQSLSGAVARFQIVQESPSLVTVRLLWNGSPDEKLRRKIERTVSGMWDGMVCRTEDVESFPLGPRGKFRKVIRAF